MSDASSVPETLSTDRLALAETRRRLGVHTREAAALAAPSRLLTAGINAVKTEVTAGIDAVKTEASAQVAGAVHGVSALTSAEARPGLLTLVAGAVGSLLLGLLARRRERRGVVRHGRVASVVRSGSPWLGLALTIATAYLRRPADPAH